MAAGIRVDAFHADESSPTVRLLAPDTPGLGRCERWRFRPSDNEQQPRFRPWAGAGGDALELWDLWQQNIC
jgi:hypothetical protein